MGGKNARKNFSRNTRISRIINDGKKSSAKSAKTRFFKHTNIETKKWGEKNARKKLSKNTRIGYPKIVEKKSSGKCLKIHFL